MRVAAPLDQREDEDADHPITIARDMDTPRRLRARDSEHIRAEVSVMRLSRRHDRVVVALLVRGQRSRRHLSHRGAPH